MPEHHEEAYVFFLVQLTTGEPLCAPGVLSTFVCCVGAFTKEDGDWLGEINIYS